MSRDDRTGLILRFAALSIASIVYISFVWSDMGLEVDKGTFGKVALVTAAAIVCALLFPIWWVVLADYVRPLRELREAALRRGWDLRRSCIQYVAGPPTLIVTVWSIDRWISWYMPAVSRWLRMHVTAAFPIASDLGGFQSAVFSASVAVLAITVALLAVAYSVSDLDRYVVFTVILQKAETIGTLWLLVSAIITQAVLSLIPLNYPSVALGQSLMLLGTLLHVLLFSRWFGQSLQPELLVEEVWKSHKDQVERLRLTLLVLRSVTKTGHTDRIQKVLESMIDPIKDIYVGPMSNAKARAQEILLKEFQYLAVDSVRGRREEVLNELWTFVRRINQVKGLAASAWFDFVRSWFLAWYDEGFRIHDYVPYGNRSFSQIYNMLHSLANYRMATAIEDWTTDLRKIVEDALHAVGVEIWSQMEERRFRDLTQLNMTVRHFRAMLDWEQNLPVHATPEERATALCLTKEAWALVLVYIIHSAIKHASEPDILSFVQIADELAASDGNSALDTLFAAAASGRQWPARVRWFVNQRSGVSPKEGGALARYVGEVGVVINLHRRLQNPRAPFEPQARAGATNGLEAILEAATQMPPETLAQLFGKPIGQVKQLQSQYRQYLRQLPLGGRDLIENMDQVPGTPDPIETRYREIAARGFSEQKGFLSHVSQSLVGIKKHDKVVVSTLVPIARSARESSDTTVTAFYHLGSQLADRARERLLRTLFSQMDRNGAIPVYEKNLTVHAAEYCLEQAKSRGVLPRAVITSVPIETTTVGFWDEEPKYGNIGEVPIYSVSGMVHSGYTVVLGHALDNLGVEASNLEGPLVVSSSMPSAQDERVIHVSAQCEIGWNKLGADPGMVTFRHTGYIS